jgi:hypothetical protein
LSGTGGGTGKERSPLVGGRESMSFNGPDGRVDAKRIDEPEMATREGLYYHG